MVSRPISVGESTNWKLHAARSSDAFAADTNIVTKVQSLTDMDKKVSDAFAIFT